LGTPGVEAISAAMRDWYGPPIALGDVHGAVWADAGGDFHGRINGGQFLSATEWAWNWVTRVARRAARRQFGVANAGFTSLSDLISEATQGNKSLNLYWEKVETSGTAGVWFSLWGIGPHPTAGANAAAAPGGEAPTQATIGAPAMADCSPDFRFIVTAMVLDSGINSPWLCYDRLFQVDKTMNSTANESVTGVPTRYQSSTPADWDYAGGNFMFPEVGGTALANTAHNWGVAGGNECLYRNQAGTDSQTLPVVTGNANAAVRRLDNPGEQWFMPLASGDTGVMDLARMRCSAAVATGVINFVIGHPLAWAVQPVAYAAGLTDNINTAFNLTRVFDGAALAWLRRKVGGATTPTMAVHLVAG